MIAVSPFVGSWTGGVRPLPLMGGAADKAGNRFERRWTLLALLDLLTGKAAEMCINDG